MIFYFTGTGNSLYIAKNIGQYNNENLISIASEMNSAKEHYEYTLKNSEVIGFVYPVYAWGPPKMVLEFIEKIKLHNYNGNYIFTVATCGKNIGNTVKLFNNYLKKKGLLLKAAFSIVMPNNYIVTGDVDTKEIEQKKLSDSLNTLKHINEIINRRKEDVYELIKGPFPNLVTSVVNPLFNKAGIKTSNFSVNDNCTGCGICKSVCNCQNITMEEKPIWGEKCSQCLACFHLCPVKAISYGRATENKGRYKNPNIDVSELKVK